MSRGKKIRPSRMSVAVIVDGKDEKWYLEKVKMHYASEKLRSIHLKPNLPQKKDIGTLFLLAKNLTFQGYQSVILIVDLDACLGDHRELEKFRGLYGNYLQAQAGVVNNNYNWMKKLQVIVNNPCLEYWFLLHFDKTTKFYPQFEPELKKDLQKHRGMENYDKSDRYYNQSPDIYERLNRYGKLSVARTNSTAFDISKCEEQGGSEMYRLFDYFDR